VTSGSVVDAPVVAFQSSAGCGWTRGSIDCVDMGSDGEANGIVPICICITDPIETSYGGAKPCSGTRGIDVGGGIPFGTGYERLGRETGEEC
jgi:hypothetical protein